MARWLSPVVAHWVSLAGENPGRFQRKEKEKFLVPAALPPGLLVITAKVPSATADDRKSTLVNA